MSVHVPTIYFWTSSILEIVGAEVDRCWSGADIDVSCVLLGLLKKYPPTLRIKIPAMTEAIFGLCFGLEAASR